MEMNSIPWSPVLRYATPLPMNRTPVSTVGGPFLLGNVVISKNFLRTGKIKVMHNNERGECCLHTLVDRKRKR